MKEKAILELWKAAERYLVSRDVVMGRTTASGAMIAELGSIVLAGLAARLPRGQRKPIPATFEELDRLFGED